MCFRERPLNTAELKWIDSFIRQSGPYIFAREEDGVLILPPNKVYKANPTAIQLILALKGGKNIRDLKVPGGIIAEQVNAFFKDLALLMDEERKGSNLSSMESVPYSFSYTTLPILGEIAVTYRCNNKCLFCYAGCGTGGCTSGIGTVKSELPAGEIKKIITLFKNEARIPFFSFTGGEPLIRDDLELLIRHALKEKLSVNLITNATLAVPARAKTLYKSGLRTAQVSIESDNADEHDRVTGRKGAFEETLKGIASLIYAGIEVQTNTTVSRLNRDGAVRLPRFLKKIGISRFAMNLFIPTGRTPNNRDLYLPYADTGAIVEAVRREARREEMTFYWYSPLPHCHYNPIARGLGNKSCAAMDGLLSVSPSGDVLPCSSYAEPLGSLLEESFQSIWFSQRAGFFKQKEYAPSICKECDMFIACQGACPLYWEYAGTGELVERGVPCS